MAPIKSRTLIWRVVIAIIALSFTGAKQVRAPQTYEGHWCRESGRLDDRPLTISAREILAVDLSCKFGRIESRETHTLSLVRQRVFTRCIGQHVMACAAWPGLKLTGFVTLSAFSCGECGGQQASCGGGCPGPSAE